MRIALRIAKAVLIVAQIVMLGGWTWLGFEALAPRSVEGPPVLFEAGKGRGVGALAADLKALGIIRKRTPFLLAYEMFFAPKNVKAGEYELAKGARALDILARLVDGRVVLHPVTIAEGLTARETFARLSAAGFGRPEDFEAAARDTGDISLLDPNAKSLEGYLYPETYHFEKGATAAEILRRMTEQFREVFDASLRARAREQGMSVHDVVTLASLIEKETARPAERRLVSAVFHNRLARGMKLECDPTVIYGLSLLGQHEGRLRTKDLRTDSPYNTYMHPGLPPGPICNPGRPALEAAVDPADADYLFFVSRNDGSHEFSLTLAEHLRAVRKFQH
jgi:UPF0755 protein